VFLPATATIGATVIPLSSAPLPTLRCQSAIIDGEAIVQDGNGVSDFESLSSARRRRPHSIILYAFDLMHLGGKDLRDWRLVRETRTRGGRF
jgi:ATP-dependent DNA ligase